MLLIFGGTVTSFIDFFPSQILICDWSNTGHVIKYWSCDQILACDWSNNDHVITLTRSILEFLKWQHPKVPTNM